MVAVKLVSLSDVLSDMIGSDGLALLSLKGSKEVAAAVGESECSSEFTSRARIYTPEMTTIMFCNQIVSSDFSLQHCVTRLNVDRARQGLSPVSHNTGSLAEARARLPVGILKSAGRAVALNMEETAAEQWLWNGFNIKIIDGTTLTASDTPANQEVYPQHAKQPVGGGQPLIKMVVITSFRTGAFLDCAFGPSKGKGTGEQSLAWPLLHHFSKNDLALADSYYSSYFNMARLKRQGSQFVFHAHGARKIDFRKGEKLGKKDHIVTLKRPTCPTWMTKDEYEQYPTEIKIRQVLIVLAQKGFRPTRLTIETSLLDCKAFPAVALADIYAERWQVELRLREIKSVLGMEHLNVKSPEMIEKTIWAFLLSYNEIRRLMLVAGHCLKIKPTYFSFKNAIRAFEMWGPELGRAKTEAESDKVMISMLAQIAAVEVGKRPNRREPRRRKRRPKTSKYIQKPRNLYQAEL